MDLTITPAAQTFIRRMIRFNGGEAGAGFRLVVSPGGCSGLSSEFTVEGSPRVGDAVVEVDGVRLFLPAESRILLTGATMDVADSPTETGLVFRQANGGSCGCSSTAKTPPGVATVDLATITRKH